MALPIVLVTGAGGAAGIAVIRALAGLADVVAADADGTAAGLLLTEQSGVLPLGDDPGFGPAVVALARKSGATALVCTVAEEILALHEHADGLAEAGVATWFPPAGTVRNCVDKWRFAEQCLAGGVPAPATGLAEYERVPGPWVVKPRFGRGSRDIYLVDTEADAIAALKVVPEPIVQTRLSGREFTVDTLSDRDGRLLGCVPRWRVETKAGISTKGVTFASEPLREVVDHLLTCLMLTGPSNVQGFVDAAGAISITEVNPRFSGGLPLSLAAGANLVEEYVRGVRGLPVRPDRLVARPGVRMARYFCEVFDDVDSGPAVGR